MDTKKIIDLCQKHFHFLETEFGMALVNMQNESWGCRLNYIGPVAGVSIEFEKREHYPFIKLHRLVNGTIQPGGEINEDTVLNGFDLDDIVELEGGTMLSPEGQTVEDMLALQAGHLKAYGAKILTGDFHQFPALEAKVKTRARLYKGK